ncbi:hypothetical protein ACJX0J_024751, partial [Zea mays]
ILTKGASKAFLNGSDLASSHTLLSRFQAFAQNSASGCKCFTQLQFEYLSQHEDINDNLQRSLILNSDMSKFTLSKEFPRISLHMCLFQSTMHGALAPKKNHEYELIDLFRVELAPLFAFENTIMTLLALGFPNGVPDFYDEINPQGLKVTDQSTMHNI